MSSKAALLGLLAATAGIASATHCTPKTMEIGRWDAYFHDSTYCYSGSASLHLPPVPFSNYIDYNECTPCYTLGPVDRDVKSFVLSAAMKSKISMWFYHGTACDGGIIEGFKGSVARNTTNSKLRAAGSFQACRGDLAPVHII